MEILYKVSDDFTNEQYNANTDVLKLIAYDVNESIYNDCDNKHDEDMNLNNQNEITKGNIEVISDVLESANIYIEKVGNNNMNDKLFKIIDHHEFFNDEVVNASKLINYANEVREEINNHLYDDEQEWPLITKVDDAIYTLEYDNYEVQEIK